jgi:ABC-type bacteriocin/lantibiotic exporter with double-glycine peptidase domain
MNIGNFGVGILLSFVFSWTITLLVLAFVPLMIISGVLQTKMMTGFSSKDKEVIEEAGKITNEAIGNIRTVTSLSKQDYFVQKYVEKITIPSK